MVRWIGVCGRFVNPDYIRAFEIRKSKEVYTVMALMDSSISGNGPQWEVVATCITGDKAYGYLKFFLGDELVNAKGGRPSLGKHSNTE